jgi:hypothetical protein
VFGVDAFGDPAIGICRRRRITGGIGSGVPAPASRDRAFLSRTRSGFE